MKRFFSLLLWFAFSIFISLEVNAGGAGGVGGGGGGIACFKNRAEKQKYLNKDGSISLKNRQFIKSIFVGETFDIIKQDNIVPNNDENARAFLERLIQTRIERLNVVFAHHLRKALSLTDFRNWQENHELGPGDDSGDDTWLKFKISKNPECTPVRIAYRESTYDENGFLNAKIVFDSDYYKRIALLNPGTNGVLQQAMLQLHEALYLILAEFGEQDSMTTRLFALDLLSDNYSHFYILIGNSPTFAFRAELAKYGFNQFTKTLTRSRQFSQNKLRHIADYKSLTQKRFEVIDRWASSPIADLKASDIHPITFLNIVDDSTNFYVGDSETLSTVAGFLRSELPKLLTPGEAFMAVAIEALRKNAISNYDVLLSADFDDSETKQKVCEFNRSTLQPKTEALRTLISKANEYCFGKF